jgi:methyl-accepting chemotaxis protein
MLNKKYHFYGSAWYYPVIGQAYIGGVKMQEKKGYRFSLRLKLVAFTTVLAVITYSTSAFFIYYLYDFVSHLISEHLFTIITLLLGIFWSGVLAYFAAGFVR